MELEEVPEKDSEHNQSKLVQFAIGSVLTIAALLPTSGCIEGYSSPRGYGPAYHSSPTIIVPSRSYRPHYPPQHFNNRPGRPHRR